MFARQRTGSVVCPGCGYLVGVTDETCYNCGRRNPSLWGFSPLIRSLGQDLGFVYLIMVGTIGLYLATLAASGSEVAMTPGVMLGPATNKLILFGASGAGPVFGLGHWWTVLSAGWLHVDLLHIFFNLLWVRQLAPETAELFGPGRTVIIYTVAGIVGFALTSIMFLVLPGLPVLGGAWITAGASAPIFGLLGALVAYGRRTGSSVVSSSAWQYAVILFLLPVIAGAIGGRGGTDNWAHAGGFVGGFVAASLMNPRKSEGVDQLLIALVCLAATAASVVASLVLNLRQLG